MGMEEWEGEDGRWGWRRGKVRMKGGDGGEREGENGSWGWRRGKVRMEVGDGGEREGEDGGGGREVERDPSI